MVVHDCHCHFLSTRFFEALGREKHGAAAEANAETVARELGWEAPGDAAALAGRWVEELDRHKVSKAALIGSVPGDEESVAVAVAAHPQRFVGFFALNPTAPDGLERMPGVADHVAEHLDGHVDTRFSIDPAHLDEAIGRIHAAAIRTLTVQPPSLDALFLSTYEDDRDIPHGDGRAAGARRAPGGEPANELRGPSPFGGGAHMCLGLHFAYMQVKILLAHLLSRYQIEIEAGYAPEWQPWPIPKPKDGLKVTFKPL